MHNYHKNGDDQLKTDRKIDQSEFKKLFQALDINNNGYLNSKNCDFTYIR